ncbi:30S ribosomal protein S13 [candidate division WOR-3 bacterium]|jgi:small subunit ribosomal protein S13|nr:30S ribosomal protein S13 [candidate division WOR-3 bacterium]
MARIAGVDLPANKPAFIGLTAIFGIGRTTAMEILEKAEIPNGKRIKELTNEEIDSLRRIIEETYKVEGEKKSEIRQNINRLKDIKCYRGIRHRQGLPVRGQRTRTNARTRKGPKKGAVALKKREIKK